MRITKNIIDTIYTLCRSKRIYNSKKNILGMMPHPERGSFNRQVPGFKGDFNESESLAPAAKILQAMVKIKSQISGMSKNQESF